MKHRVNKKIKKFLYNATSWAAAFVVIFTSFAVIFIGQVSASTSGQLVEYLHKENSDANETYNSMGLTPPEAASDTATGSPNISFVQSNSAGAASVNYTSAPTQNDLLVAYVFDSSKTAPTISSGGWTAGNATCATGNGSSARAGLMFWKIAGAGESSTVTSTGAAIAVAEYSGVDTTTPNIGDSAQANASGTNTTPSLTPTAGKKALVVAGLGVRSSSQTYSSASVTGTNSAAASQRENPGTTSASAVLFDSFVSSTSGAYQGSATPSANAVGCGSISVFQAAGPSNINVNSTPPTSFCEANTNTVDKFNQVSADSGTVANRCVATFISQPLVGPSGGTIALNTGDTASITGQFWSSESNTTVTAALNAYVYRWSGSGTTVTSTDRIATLTCADPGTSATSCAPSAVSPANNVTFSAGDRMVVIMSMNVTAVVASSTVSSYFDSTGRTAAFVKMGYTSYGYNSSNKPALSGTQDDDFTANASTTACTTGGVAYNTKWTCLQGSAANTAGNFNAASVASPTGDSTGWLWLQNKTTSTAAAVSNFGTTPSNTFLYQTLPSGYQDGTVTTVVNSSGMYDVASAGSASPYSHTGLVLWTSNSDYLELQVYSDAATNDNGTNNVHVALNNSSTLSGIQNLNSTTTGNSFSNIWLRFANTAGSYQAQYSTDGSSFTNVGGAVSHSAFSRTGLNAFTAIANPLTSYAGAFEWFEQTMLPAAQYNQTSYRWFDSANQADPPGSAFAAQNTAYTLTSGGQQFRLRQLIKPDQNVSAGSQNFSEQYADLSAYGSCSAIPGGNWITIGGSGSSTLPAGSGADGGGANIWSTTANITSDDTSAATVSLPTRGISNPLNATNFGFSIPAGSTISGIQVVVARYNDSSGTDLDSTAQLLKAGVQVGTGELNASNWTGAFTHIPYGSSSDLWGATWTAADINDPGFGFAIAVHNISTTQTSNAFVGFIGITVNYVPPSSVSYYDNATPNSGDAITYHAGTDPTDSGTYTAQTYQEADNFGVANTISANTDGEWDLSLYDNGAPAGTTYCLRTVKADGTPLDTYTNYPMITAYSAPVGPTMDQLLRGGEYFSLGGIKQPFFWAN